jgi:hypothetical protein
VKAEEPTYVLVETMNGEVLGGFAASPWHIDKNVSHTTPYSILQWCFANS